MARIEITHCDLDATLWLPDPFLEKALDQCLRRGMENGLNIESIEDGLGLTYTIRKAVGSNKQNHFDILVALCNGDYRELRQQINETSSPQKIIQNNFPDNYRIKNDTNPHHNSSIVKWMVDEYKSAKQRYMEPCTNVEEVLDDCLREGRILTVVSNGLTPKQFDKLRDLRLQGYFRADSGIQDYLVQVSDEEPGKEKPLPYLWEKQREKIIYHFPTYQNSKEAHVGDKLWDDILGANSQGIITIKVNQGRHSNEGIEDVLRRKNIPTNLEYAAEGLLQPDVVIDKISQLPGALKDLDEGRQPIGDKERQKHYLAKKLHSYLR